MVSVTSWKEGQQEVTPVHEVNSQCVTNRKDGRQWKSLWCLAFMFWKVAKYQQVAEAE